MDNRAAHHDQRVAGLCAARGVEVIYLPPYSPDFNPIESEWALQKQFVRRHAPRTKDALRRVASQDELAIASRHVTAAAGSRTAAIEVKPTDLWG